MNEHDRNLANLRAKLMGGVFNEGVGNVTITRTDDTTITFEGVVVDSIGPLGANPGTIGVEFDRSERIIHVPFVKFWEVSY